MANEKTKDDWQKELDELRKMDYDLEDKLFKAAKNIKVSNSDFKKLFEKYHKIHQEYYTHITKRPY